MGEPAQGRWATAGAEVLALLLGASCPGCDRPGTLLCGPCRAVLVDGARCPVTLITPGGLPVRAALSFEGVAARCIRMLKEEGATMLARPLAQALAGVLAGTAGEVAVVPVPTSRPAFRRRGYRVPELLVRRAGRIPQRLLLPARRTGDQRGLGRAERARNVAGSMRASGRGGDRPVVVFDDVVTTGVTMDEAARALRAAGFRPVGAVALAATPRRAREAGHAMTGGDSDPGGRLA